MFAQAANYLDVKRSKTCSHIAPEHGENITNVAGGNELVQDIPPPILLKVNFET